MGRSTILAAVGALLIMFSVAPPVAAGPIVGEWEPGLSEAEVGGPLVVDGYGVNGLGAYQVQVGDGTTRAAVCVQADVGHSLAADYVVEPGLSLAAELGYLLWAHLGAATDVAAAAINILAWRYTDAQRRTGGPVWQGDEVEVRALGVGRLGDVEEAVRRLHAEATARRGPWTFTELVVADGTATIGVSGPGGPIADVPVTFTAGAWTVIAISGPDGHAAAALTPDAETIAATAEGPGGAVALVAPGSQRLAMAGPPVGLAATASVPPPTTTTTTTTLPPSTTVPTTVPPTTVPTTTEATTTAASTTTATTTEVPTTTATVPSPIATSTTATTTTTTTTTATPPTTTTSTPRASTTVVTPPTLPRTGGGSRAAVRLGSVLFAVGAGAVLVAVPRRRPR